jgi:flagellar hook-length control protein FliK
MEPGQEVVLRSATSPTVRVSVQHQETHFSPVIDGFTTKVVDAEDGAPADGIAPGEKGLPPGVLKDAVKKSDTAAGSASMPASSQANAAAVVSSPADSEQTAALEGSAMDRQLRKLEIADTMTDTGPKSDAPSSLPPAMLQRIAGAVLSEARQMRSEANIHAHQMDNAHFLTTAKASEGAARLLSIQLHPADLGLITVKMRLSGDSLEMEIQVSSEETAQLLRNDAEKLSGLLKGSGYRPDMITIQNGPAASAQTDASQSQRQQSMSQSQQEAFERGAQQQGSGSQQREQPYENERKGGRHEASGEGNPNNRSAGGVYL